jgi:hypothetical protein
MPSRHPRKEQADQRSCAQRNWLAHRLAQRAILGVLPILSRAGSPVVPVKGIALAQWLYASDSERPMKDADLLVPRAAFDTCVDLARRAGHKILYETRELGELLMSVSDFHVEIHAEFGRRELTTLSVDEVLARAKPDRLHGLEVLRIDDIDHFLLLAVNVIKDGFVWSNAHQSEDLARMLAVLTKDERIEELLARTREASFVSGLESVARWMAEEHGSSSFSALLPRLSPRRAYSLMARAVRRLPPSQRNLGLLFGCWTNDKLSLRVRATWRLSRRGAARLLGRSPD